MPNPADARAALATLLELFDRPGGMTENDAEWQAAFDQARLAQAAWAPAVRQTRSYAELGLSEPAYDEIAKKLEAAGYDHAFMANGCIDMHGIAVTLDPEYPKAVPGTSNMRALWGGCRLGNQCQCTSSDQQGKCEHRDDEAIARIDANVESTLGVAIPQTNQENRDA